MLNIWDKYKIKKEYRQDILQSLKMAYDNIDDNIINKIWKISDIDNIYKNKDLLYYDLDEVMFWFECDWIYIWINLNEIKKIKEKPKKIKNQIKLNFIT